MTDPAAENAAPGQAAELVSRWARQVCDVPEASATVLAQVLQLDLDAARRVGAQRVFPPSEAITHAQFVVDADGDTLHFLELRTRAPLTVADLTATFGAGRLAAPGPHQVAPTMIFDIPDEGSPRKARVLARCVAGYPDVDTVREIVVLPVPVTSD
ncbi:hypothetical protein [Micromonospora sp. NPDC023814]|uniref:hypothetical protein n=1 Tax=Micromonospora sp. NPDC023814 TaxID=3154596 RepID=UPI0033D9BAF2